MSDTVDLLSMDTISRGPTHIFQRMWGGGGGLSDLFGSEVLAKCDFFGSMKDARIFLGRKKEEWFFWVAKKGLRDFLGYAKKSREFFR